MDEDHSLRWLKKLLAGEIRSDSYFKAALLQIRKDGEILTPGSVYDDADSPTNICFLNCRELDFAGRAFLRTDPKKIIFLCREEFDYGIKMGKWEDLVRVVTHEMIHWIDDSQSRLDLADRKDLYCSEIRAALLSGQCQNYYNGKNKIFDMLLNRSHECAKEKAMASMKMSGPYTPAEGDFEKCLQNPFPWASIPINEKAADAKFKEFFLDGDK